MREIAIDLYNRGYNCALCIIIAATRYYGINLPDECERMCAGLYGGLGVGRMCSALVGGVLVLGLMFGERRLKTLRIKLLMDAVDHFESIDCAMLARKQRTGEYCAPLVGEIASLLEEIINEELQTAV